MRIKPPYESPALRDITGPAIRPGGLELTERAMAFCDLAPGARVLDLGCGIGASVAYLRRSRGLAAFGLDLSAGLLGEADQVFGRLPLVRGRAEQPPLADVSLAAVLCECVLSLCPDPVTVLAQAHRMLSPDGFLIVTDIYARTPGYAPRVDRSQIRSCLDGAMDRNRIESCLAGVGFERLLWEDHTPLLKHLAARLVLAFGSRATWQLMSANINWAGPAVCGDRPGYYLLVARKKEPKNG